MDDYIVTYAQNREDIILKAFFKNLEKGFYVDVGAYHPSIASVTKIFYDQGWRGINIEPNRTQFKYFKEDRPEDINLQIGVSDRAGKLTLHEYPQGLSTFSAKMYGEYKKNSQSSSAHQNYEVDVLPIKDIFEEYKINTINFMKIDVEGYEYEVIKGNDWNKYRPQVLCIEANHIIKDWRPLIKKADYTLVFFDGLNDYYVANECAKIKKEFSYVDSLLLDKPVVQIQFHERMQSSEVLRKKLEIREGIIRDITDELNSLYAIQNQKIRIRTIFKQLVQSINGAILQQIDKLNRPKEVKLQPIDYSSDASAHELLLQIKQHDLGKYYNPKTVHPVAYRLLHGVYTLMYRTLKFSVRIAFRMFRMFYRRIRNG